MVRVPSWGLRHVSVSRRCPGGLEVLCREHAALERADQPIQQISWLADPGGEHRSRQFDPAAPIDLTLLPPRSTS